MKYFKSILLIFSACLSFSAAGQKSDEPLTITGKVFDISKDPVEGAVFYIDNFKTTFTTKKNGSYKISVSPSAMNLEVRSEHSSSGKILINGQTKIDFTLNVSTDDPSQNMSDSSKLFATPDPNYKPPKVKAKKMNNYNNIYQMIRSEVPEVIVSGRSIQIQQGHSFFGSGTPLFVLNGVIVSSIDNVNPLEVKSIRVLKGSQAAVYGQQGTNGVLVITLLNGTEKEK